MALNRIALNKVSLKRMTVPGTGGGGTPAPAGPTSYTAVQVFTGSQTWTPPSGVTQVDYLVVAGGGGGALDRAGGGGAGGYLSGTGFPVNFGQAYPVTVGAGGAAGEAQRVPHLASRQVDVWHHDEAAIAREGEVC